MSSMRLITMTTSGDYYEHEIEAKNVWVMSAWLYEIAALQIKNMNRWGIPKNINVRDSSLNAPKIQ